MVFVIVLSQFFMKTEIPSHRINGAAITPVQPGFKAAANPWKSAVSFDIQIYSWNQDRPSCFLGKVLGAAVGSSV